MSREQTLIPIKKSTRERLKKVGRKGETYDQIINKLIDIFEKKQVRFEK